MSAFVVRPAPLRARDGSHIRGDRRDWGEGANEGILIGWAKAVESRAMGAPGAETGTDGLPEDKNTSGDS